VAVLLFPPVAVLFPLPPLAAAAGSAAGSPAPASEGPAAGPAEAAEVTAA